MHRVRKDLMGRGPGCHKPTGPGLEPQHCSSLPPARAICAALGRMRSYSWTQHPQRSPQAPPAPPAAPCPCSHQHPRPVPLTQPARHSSEHRHGARTSPNSRYFRPKVWQSPRTPQHVLPGHALPFTPHLPPGHPRRPGALPGARGWGSTEHSPLTPKLGALPLPAMGREGGQHRGSPGGAAAVPGVPPRAHHPLIRPGPHLLAAAPGSNRSPTAAPRSWPRSRCRCPRAERAAAPPRRGCPGPGGAAHDRSRPRAGRAPAPGPRHPAPDPGLPNALPAPSPPRTRRGAER